MSKVSYLVQKNTNSIIAKNHFRPLEDSSGTYGTFMVATKENDIMHCTVGALTPSIKTWFTNFNQPVLSERLYLTAIDNLLKKVEYLQLSSQFDQELITEEEFSFELETYEDRYLIKANDNFSPEEFDLVITIANKLKHKQFSTDELSEIFSIPLELVDDFVFNYEVKNIGLL